MKKYLTVTFLLLGCWLVMAPAKVNSQASQPPKLTEDQELGDLAIRLMAYAPKMTNARKQFIAKTFVRVSNEVFEKQEHKEYFALVLAIESRFDPRIQNSSAGAVGIAQLMPAYVKEFGKLCNIQDATAEDVSQDYEMGMTIGACLFRSLIEAYQGNVASALLAYNAGKASLSLKQLHSLGTITNTESASYLAKFLYLGEEFKREPLRLAMRER